MALPPHAAYPRPLRIGVVGLGVIGAVHAKVISAMEGLDLVFAADPMAERTALVDPGVARFERIEDALARLGGSTDAIVIATPTDTHLDLAGLALARTDALVLSEKPLARDPEALAHFEAQHAPQLHRLRIVNHFAYSPEVEWAVKVSAAGRWGAPEWVLCHFNDPYLHKTPTQRRTYVSSWVDSGANQFSMLARFAQRWRVLSHDADPEGMRSITQVDYEGGSAVFTTNWRSGDSSKQSVLRWATGHELVLDHTAMTGLALLHGRPVEHLSHDAAVDRKTAHYLGMYRALLAGDREGLLGVPLARSVAVALAEAPREHAASNGVKWSEVEWPQWHG